MDPQTIAQLWAQRMGAATSKATAGANRLTVSPTQSAANAAAFWQSQVSSPQALAKFKAGLARTTLTDWQQAYINKGVPRMATGAQAAIPKFSAFLSNFLPFLNSVTATVRAMPKDGLESNIARMVAQVRGVAAYKRPM